MKRGPKPRIKELQQEAAANSVVEDLIEQVFNFWKATMDKKKTTILDTKRRRRIGWAIKNYGLEPARNAILGCSYSTWHMGQNPGSKTYNDISLIFRDAEHVEMFLDRYDKSVAKSAADNWIDEGFSPPSRPQ